MAKISNVRNDGDSTVTTGPKNANSYNVYPVNFVATPAPGTILQKSHTNNFEFFNAAQTSANSDQIALSASLAVGTEVEFLCVSICKIVSIVGSGIGINGGTDAQGIVMAAGSLYQLVKTTATNWICSATTAAGAVTAPTPA